MPLDKKGAIIYIVYTNFGSLETGRAAEMSMLGKSGCLEYAGI